jgi:4'-phosphopantetheinyl transferase
MTAIPPPLRAWSKRPKNRCAPGEIAAYWKTCDVLTFIADIGMYSPSLLNCLDSAEKERVLEFKSEYFKKRFMVSRSLLKSILVHLQGTGNRNPLVLSQKNKRVLVPGIHDIFISLSYSGSSLAITVSKRKTGCDIEKVRSADLKKVRSSPVFDCWKSQNKKEESHHTIHVWTLVEAYAKLKDQNPYPLLSRSSLLHDAGFVSYCIDKCLILSLAYDPGTFSHAMFWIDPEQWSLGLNKKTCKNSPFPK